MSLTAFRTLGRSGLIVSPFALGTMTFGTPRWGASDEISESVFHTYVDAGGNFIDTADVYAKGRNEELVGRYIRDHSLRDQLVLATKFTFHSGESGNPNAGGNGRKNIYRAIEGSLRRLQTDYVDLYWLHAWDMVTPVEEVLQSLGDLVRARKIRYFGFSDVPAWYTAKPLRSPPHTTFPHRLLCSLSTLWSSAASSANICLRLTMLDWASAPGVRSRVAF